MTLVQEGSTDIEKWGKDIMAKNSLKSIIIQIEQNKLLTEKQKQDAIKILKEDAETNKV